MKRSPGWHIFNSIFNSLSDVMLPHSFNTVFFVCILHICIKSLAWLWLFKTFPIVLCTAYPIFSIYVFCLLLIKILKHEVNLFVHLLHRELLSTYFVPDTPPGSGGYYGASITFPFSLYFSLKTNCTEQIKLFKLGLETKSGAANFSC